MTYGIYVVTPGHTYRGRLAGEEFEARTDRHVERRACDRGVIRFLGVIQHALVPGSYAFPRGWHSPQRKG